MTPVVVCQIVITAVALVMGGCTVVEKARIVAAETFGRAIVAECSIAQPERSKNLDAINSWLATGRFPHRATALDCDGDGEPDF